MPENDLPILTVSPSLSFRVVEFVKLISTALFVAVLTFVIVTRLAAFLHRVLTDGLLYLVGFTLLILEVFIVAACLGLLYWAVTEFRSFTSFSLSKTKLEVDRLTRPYDPMEEVPPEDTFAHSELQLADVRTIRIKKGWLARRLGYGTVEILTDRGLKPAAVVPGVQGVEIFKARLDALVADLVPVSSQD
jgi:hypothetical protein